MQDNFSQINYVDMEHDDVDIYVIMRLIYVVITVAHNITCSMFFT